MRRFRPLALGAAIFLFIAISHSIVLCNTKENEELAEGLATICCLARARYGEGQRILYQEANQDNRLGADLGLHIDQNELQISSGVSVTRLFLLDEFEEIKALERDTQGLLDTLNVRRAMISSVSDYLLLLSLCAKREAIDTYVVMCKDNLAIVPESLSTSPKYLIDNLTSEYLEYERQSLDLFITMVSRSLESSLGFRWARPKNCIELWELARKKEIPDTLLSLEDAKLGERIISNTAKINQCYREILRFNQLPDFTIGSTWSSQNGFCFAISCNYQLGPLLFKGNLSQETDTTWNINLSLQPKARDAGMGGDLHQYADVDDIGLALVEMNLRIKKYELNARRYDILRPLLLSAGDISDLDQLYGLYGELIDSKKDMLFQYYKLMILVGKYDN